VLRRLTAEELRRAVGRLLDVDASGIDLPADLRADGFSNTAGAQAMTLDHIERYAAMAENVAAATDLDALRRRLDVCDDASCLPDAVAETAELLYRRVPEPEEQTALQSVVDAVTADGGGADEALRFALEATLQSPGFLYRLEAAPADGSSAPVDAAAYATRLAFLLWAAPPDPALLARAEAGDLATDDGVRRAVRDLLNDPRAQDGLRVFVRQWLHLDRLDGLARDRDQFPDWRNGLGTDMKEETLRLFESVVWNDQPLTAVHDADYTFASDRLAALYGLPGSPEGDRYDLRQVPERGGLITHGSVLTTGGARASLVEKGLWFLETVLCGVVEAPMVDVVMQMGELEPGFTQRTYAEERLDNPACASCHTQMDPLAFGLERFDGIGSYRETDEYGNALRSDGALQPPGDPVATAYETVGELATLLAEHPRVAECQILKATQYALGRALTEADGCSLAQIRERTLAGGSTYAALVEAIALSPSLRRIRSR
jgi:hypothetical protein